MKVTFGDWVRWNLARRDLDRSAAAQRLGISSKSITNLYRRETPEGVNDVTLSKLARMLGMTEPELMVKWKNGLPAAEVQMAIEKTRPGRKRKPYSSAKQ